MKYTEMHLYLINVELSNEPGTGKNVTFSASRDLSTASNARVADWSKLATSKAVATQHESRT